MYLSDHSKNLISAEEKVAELIKQRDQLRAEVERLGRATTNGQLNWMQESERQQARAESERQQARAERDQLRDLLTEWKVSAHIKGEAIDSLLIEREQLRAARDECERQFQDKVQRLGEEAEVTNQLRAEVKLLTEWQQGVIENARAHHAQLKDATARAERAEAELAAELERATHYRDQWQKVTAELAAERARLDWLEKQDGGFCHIKWGEYQNYWGPAFHTKLRAAIDAAMKEGAK